MTSAMDTGRIALALCLAVLAFSVPALRFAVLDWIVAADLVPGRASVNENEMTGHSLLAPNSIAPPA